MLIFVTFKFIMLDGVNLKRKENRVPARGLILCSLSFGLGILWFLVSGMQASTVVLAQEASANGISQPASGSVISGTVIVQGTATDPNYLRYELAFFQDANPGAGWIVFAEGDQQVVDGTLAVWDTTAGRAVGAPIFPDGGYRLRLRVVRTDYNYDEYYVDGLAIVNEGTITPTPTLTPTVTVAPPATAESAPAAPQPQATSRFHQPTALPSLTPFPTVTPPATPANQTLGSTVGPTDGGDGGGGVLGQVASVDTGRFARAFWQGVTITGYIFAALALYLIFRGIGRRLWRILWAKITR